MQIIQMGLIGTHFMGIVGIPWEIPVATADGNFGIHPDSPSFPSVEEVTRLCLYVSLFSKCHRECVAHETSMIFWTCIHHNIYIYLHIYIYINITARELVKNPKA
jgi:hypothetical protein